MNQSEYIKAQEDIKKYSELQSRISQLNKLLQVKTLRVTSPNDCSVNFEMDDDNSEALNGFLFYVKKEISRLVTLQLEI